jgi:inhibitor of cysteine peptidase
MPDTHEEHDLSGKCGDKFKIEVGSNPSTGYKWHLLSFNEDIVKLVPSKFVSELTNHIGSSGREHFNFEAKKKGRTSIKIVYRRTWEKQPMKSKEYFVIVT